MSSLDVFCVCAQPINKGDSVVVCYSIGCGARWHASCTGLAADPTRRWRCSNCRARAACGVSLSKFQHLGTLFLRPVGFSASVRHSIARVNFASEICEPGRRFYLAFMRAHAKSHDEDAVLEVPGSAEGTVITLNNVKLVAPRQKLVPLLDITEHVRLKNMPNMLSITTLDRLASPFAVTVFSARVAVHTLHDDASSTIQSLLRDVSATAIDVFLGGGSIDGASASRLSGAHSFVAASSASASGVSEIMDPRGISISIIDPLMLTTIEKPVRGDSCRHIQCFDARTYMNFNIKAGPRARWRCPVCRISALPAFLVVDPIVADILKCVREGSYGVSGKWTGGKIVKGSKRIFVGKNLYWQVADVDVSVPSYVSDDEAAPRSASISFTASTVQAASRKRARTALPIGDVIDLT